MGVPFQCFIPLGSSPALLTANLSVFVLVLQCHNTSILTLFTLSQKFVVVVRERKENTLIVYIFTSPNLFLISLGYILTIPHTHIYSSFL